MSQTLVGESLTFLLELKQETMSIHILVLHNLIFRQIIFIQISMADNRLLFQHDSHLLAERF
jgi:hypothetical protein